MTGITSTVKIPQAEETPVQLAPIKRPPTQYQLPHKLIILLTVHAYYEDFCPFEFAKLDIYGIYNLISFGRVDPTTPSPLAMATTRKPVLAKRRRQLSNRKDEEKVL